MPGNSSPHSRPVSDRMPDHEGAETPVPGATDFLTFAIGDVHGCLEKLKALLHHCQRFAADRRARFVFVGDYVDRGRDSKGVIELLQRFQHERRDVICLRGNHEAMMIEAAFSPDPRSMGQWLVNGGGATLASYGVDHPADVPPSHLKWIASLPFSFDDGRRFFVHAGVNPSLPLDAQSEEDQVWIREPFLSSSHDFGRLIVHGHTPVPDGRPDLRRNRLNIDTAAVLGGPLTAAVFTSDRTEPIAYLTHLGSETEAATLPRS